MKLIAKDNIKQYLTQGVTRKHASKDKKLQVTFKIMKIYYNFAYFKHVHKHFIHDTILL